MKDLHSIRWYADYIKPKLPKEVYEPVPTRLLGGLGYLIIISLCILVLNNKSMHFLHKVSISVILGFSFAALGFLGHEILHGTVVRTPWLRDLLGALAFWPLSVGPKLWIKWHNMNHHAHTQQESLDPDAWLTLEKLLGSKFLQLVYRLPLSFRAFINLISLSFMFSLHSVRMFMFYIKDCSRHKLRFLGEFALPWCSWIILAIFLGFEGWLYSYLLPMLIGNFIVMAYISTNHRLNPLVAINDPLENSLTVTVPNWVDFLHFNFSYHTEHHLFPGINPKYYPLIKKHIKAFWPNRYHEMPLLLALRSLYKTPRIYYKGEEFLDPSKKRVYNSLANGLNPHFITYREVDRP